jgi:hypothetical protein
MCELSSYRMSLSEQHGGWTDGDCLLVSTAPTLPPKEVVFAAN